MKKNIYFISLFVLAGLFQNSCCDKRQLTCSNTLLKKEKTRVLFYHEIDGFNKKLKRMESKISNLPYDVSAKVLVLSYGKLISLLEFRLKKNMVLHSYYKKLSKKCGEDAMEVDTRYMNIGAYERELQGKIAFLKGRRDLRQKNALRRVAFLKKQKKVKAKINLLAEKCKGKAEKSEECKTYVKNANPYCSGYIKSATFMDCIKDKHCFYQMRGPRRKDMLCESNYSLKMNAKVWDKDKKDFNAVVSKCRKRKYGYACQLLNRASDVYCEKYKYKKTCSDSPICYWNSDGVSSKATCTSKGDEILDGNI